MAMTADDDESFFLVDDGSTPYLPTHLLHGRDSESDITREKTYTT